MNQAGAEQIGVLFVCTANVCRSPTAHGIFEDFVERLGMQNRIKVDSAGTNARDLSKPPEPRALRIAALEGFELGGLRSRKIEATDFEHFDYIICMDESHLEKINAIRPEDYHGEVSLLLEYLNEPGLKDVPDPYYGGAGDFKRALQLIEAGCYALLDHIVKKRF